MDKRNLAFGIANFVLLAIVIIGFILMSGSGSTDTQFNPDIFSPMRVKVAPVITFIGFISIIGAIMYKPKSETEQSDDHTAED